MSLDNKKRLFSEMDGAKKKPGYKDVMLAYYASGVGALKECHTVDGASSGVIARGVKELIKKSAFRTIEDQREAVAFLNEISVKVNRSGIKVGDVREYKALAVKDNVKPWGRIPLHHLGVEKGGKIIVEFNEDNIVIRKKNEDVK